MKIRKLVSALLFVVVAYTTVTQATLAVLSDYGVTEPVCEPGTVVSFQEINELEGGFTGDLTYWGLFGTVANIGDLDGDGITDMAVGAHHDNDGGSKSGAVWILFMNPDSTVKGHQKISRTSGNFSVPLRNYDYFGTDIAYLGDIDGDGIQDIAVTSHEDYSTGSVWILFMNRDGSVKTQQRINSTEGNFGGVLETYDRFGVSISSLGDFDGDGITDIAVGAGLDDDGGTYRGAVWILFLKPDGTVKSHQKISSTQGDFTGVIDNDDRFSTVTSIGDFDGDGITDIAVGAVNDDDGGNDRGAIWILLLNDDATVRDYHKISNTSGGFEGVLADGDHFGASIADMGDIDSDGVHDLAIGAPHDEDGGVDTGAVWLLFLNSDGTVKDHKKISDNHSNLAGNLDPSIYFGTRVANLGDLNGDGTIELAIGAHSDDSTDYNAGSAWILSLCGNYSESNITVAIDIKPQSCPNPLRLDSKGKGVLPVAILGSEDFDVFDIDITTITLEGVAPIRSSFEDVSTPFDGEVCECSTEGPDGFYDLNLKFNRRDILTALEATYGDLTEIDNKTDLPLTLKAMLIDEEVELEGTDCIRLLNNVGKAKAKKKK